MYRIVVVDDEPNIASAIRRELSGISPDRLDGERAEIETFTSSEVALTRLSAMSVDLVISDYNMPGMNGIEFLSQVIEMQPHVGRLILSGRADLDVVVEAINRLQIDRFITKPWHDYELKSAVMQALATRRMAAENKRLADLVRAQDRRISKQDAALRRLELESPGITKLKRAEDGSILIDEDDY
jgi:DNA-binding NtrC family response regulator